MKLLNQPESTAGFIGKKIGERKKTGKRTGTGPAPEPIRTSFQNGGKKPC